MLFLFRAAALSVALFHVTPGVALAGDVTLTARSGAMEITGSLVSYDGETYRLDTRWGRLTVEASAVDCAGPGCPELQSFAPTLRIMAFDGLAGQVLPQVLTTWGRAEGLQVEQTPKGYTLTEGDTARLHITLVPPAADVTAALAAGDADGALVMPPTDGRRLTGQPVARVPLVLASSTKAPAGPIARAALRTARSQTASWKPLTGTDQPLVWHSPGQFADLAAIERFGPTRFAPVAAPDPAAALARDPWGIALLPAPLPDGLMERQVTDSCPLIRDASAFALAAGEHPLAVTVHWQSAGRKLPAEARRFAEFLTSRPEVLPGPEAALPLSAQGQRLSNALRVRNPDVTLDDLQKAVERLSSARRLPLTIRFDRSGAPDGAGRAALAALAAQAEAGAYRGYDLLLAGFTPGPGSRSANLKASLARAEAMRSALQKSLSDVSPPRPALRVEGFGEALPVACDDTPEGRYLNHRVEAWLLPAP